MTVGVHTCGPETPVVDLARLMLENGLEAVVVLEEGNALGTVTQQELVRAYSAANTTGLTASEIMQEGVPQVPPDIPLKTAAQLMLDRGLRAIFLMLQSAGIEYPAAVLTFQHLLRHLVARSPGELRDLGINADRQSPLASFIQRRDAARKKTLRSSKS
jgi:CBS domain-containing protein